MMSQKASVLIQWIQPSPDMKKPPRGGLLSLLYVDSALNADAYAVAELFVADAQEINSGFQLIG